MNLYLFLLLISISIPLALSFDKRLHFYTYWKSLFPAMILVAILFLPIDIYFTRIGVWGFNPQYHSNILLGGLPIDEWLFFIIVPYASLFLHFALFKYFPKWELFKATGRNLTYTFIFFFSLVAILHTGQTYTFYASLLMILTLVLSLFDGSGSINRFYVSFLIILIPFILINGTLTGTFITGEIVWYNNVENLGIRFLTIPVEDFAYAFSLLQLNLMLTNWFRQKKKADILSTLNKSAKITES